MSKIPMLEKFAAQSLVEHDGELIFSKEKFAELIVQECVEVVKWTPSMFPNDEYVKNIKQHFGVEE